MGKEDFTYAYRSEMSHASPPGIMENQIRVVVRAIIIREDEILLCQPKGANWYFFPGGGIHFEEGIEDALRRELKEELDAELLESRFIGVVESTFLENEQRKHEINIVFHVRINDVPLYSQEPHILFACKKIKELDNENVVPTELKKAVLQWIKNRKTFWIPMNKTTSR